MAAPTPGLQEAQVGKAIVALLRHVEKQQQGSRDLLAGEELLYLIVALRRSPAHNSRKDKPRRIPLPHPLADVNTAEVCLFVKDRKGEGHKAAKAAVKERNIPGVAKVVGLSKLRTKYESFEAKRALCGSYDIFLADDRVLPMLPKLIGKTFFRKKKQPIPVDLTHPDWAAQVRKAVNATYLYPSSGSCLNIRVGHSGQSAGEVQANLEAALQGALRHIPRGWANVQALHLKTATSASLPLYQTLPQDIPPEQGDEEGTAGEEAAQSPPAAGQPAAAGKAGGKGKRPGAGAGPKKGGAAAAAAAKPGAGKGVAVKKKGGVIKAGGVEKGGVKTGGVKKGAVGKAGGGGSTGRAKDEGPAAKEGPAAAKAQELGARKRAVRRQRRRPLLAGA